MFRAQIFFFLILLLQMRDVLSEDDASKTIEAKSSEVRPVQFSLPSLQPREAGGLLTMTLLGSALAVAGNLAPGLAGQERANERIDYEPRSVTYAKNVAAFEDRIERKIKNGVSAARKRAKTASRSFRNSIRRTATAGFGTIHRGVNGLSRLADRRFRSMARATSNGLKRLSGAAIDRVGRMGNGAGYGIFRFGTAARAGLARMTNAYARTVSRAGHGILGAGSAASKGIGRVAKTYMRGISRLGQATARIGESVSRMGLLPGSNDQTEQPIAEEKSSATFSDKKLKDCLMQTLCYIGAPYMSGNQVQRKRMLQSLADIYSEETGVPLDENEAVMILHERHGNEIDDSDVRAEDCEIFQCQIASLGRRAYQLVYNLREPSKS